MNGQTSVAPMRGCAPVCFRMSINSAAFWIPRNAASTAASGVPANVTTVRFVLAPGSTFSSDTPSTDSIAVVICRITSRSRPSEKFGTHSITFFIAARFPLPDAGYDDAPPGSERHLRQCETGSDKGSVEDSRAGYLPRESKNIRGSWPPVPSQIATLHRIRPQVLMSPLARSNS